VERQGPRERACMRSNPFVLKLRGESPPNDEWGGGRRTRSGKMVTERPTFCVSATDCRRTNSGPDAEVR